MSQRAPRIRSHTDRSPAKESLIRTLSTLVELERGFRAACEAAAQRLSDDHRRAVRDDLPRLRARPSAAITTLSERLVDLGAVAPDELTSRRLLGNSADLIRSLPRRQRVLRALASAAAEVDGAYRRAADEEHIEEDTSAVLRALRAKLAIDRAALEAMEHAA